MKHDFIITAIFLLSTTTVLLAQGTVNENQFTGSKYVVDPQYYSCTDFTGWFTSTTYCDISWACTHCSPWLEGRFEDQYRYRTCTDSQSGESYKEYRFRTIRIGCCGTCIPLPSPYSTISSITGDKSASYCLEPEMEQLDRQKFGSIEPYATFADMISKVP